ncbi:MAG: UV DNA damage repair endonuclease UvsE [Fibrobacter sp.]|nr:UV DNA damage repair endonuclease UvsE [Fibrobacter sp.]
MSEDNKKNVESPFNEFGTDLRDFRFSLYTNFILYSTPGWEIKTPAGSSKHKQSVKFMIRLGYVAINTGLATASSTFRLKNYSDELMVKTAQSNLDALRRILCWNIEHRIYLFRITSALIPFGSHPVNHGIWKDLLRSQFKKAGEFISANHMRVSMHPGQYTVLNTPNDVVFKRSLWDLEYHCTVLDLMGLNTDHRIVLHGGGIYKNKGESVELLIERIQALPVHIRERLVLENDERNYSAQDIYAICHQAGTPGVLDIFHHQCNQSFVGKTIREIIMKFNETWPHSMRQKLHYSNQETGKRAGAHAIQIDIGQFRFFYQKIKDLELDIMLEAKDKQSSLLRLREAIPSLA